MTSSATQNWHGKVVVVTGGTAGLGLELVRQWLGKGASVGVIARNRERLERTVAGLGESSGTGSLLRVAGVAADVTDAAEANRAIRTLAGQWGRLDCLVNNVGVSSRHDIRLANGSDYEAAFRTNLLSAVHCLQSAREELLARQGTVVNIGSLAAKTAWPFMAPYSVSKSALAAYSHQLRLELGPALHVLLVCPGPLRRDDAGERYNGQTGSLPEIARAPGAGVRLKGIPVPALARQIIRAVERRKAELVVPGWARLAFAMGALSPRLGDWLLRQFGARKKPDKD